ncbi:hypothetical protein Q4603_12740 [Zobellia galactanivorans]|uniref:hypothetical protein n=1 Tax=Zobellia galactanivorans (strain DSM 12802 / CCUG 47099 / CIP 106680 / NCIMB 13871 / Dsij) TaxID=63186 RepID=UPI0026E1208E|nr:hypothetical protein [Zobellia galactanivorans]MDO6809488.1 hypothetical protein [Zobellia galactanivorans]
MGRKTEEKMRTYHRYLGFFLAGIMAMYAISGIILIFRDTDFLKKEVAIEKTIQPNVKANDLGKMLKIKHFKLEKEEGGIVHFEGGSYDSKTGLASYTVKTLPFVLNKMTKVHKATSSQPLFFLNIFFGASLLFFVISAFWMFRPSAPIFKKGLYFALGGLLLTLILLFV